MGERGPAAKPTALKILEGTWRADREKPEEVNPETLARCPQSLTAEGRREWKRIAPELRRLGLLTGVDVAALAAYCENYATFKECSRRIRKDGLFKGGKANPAIKVRQDALTQMKAYLREFGMTPASRARLVGAPKPAKEATPEDFLFIEPGVN